MNKKPLGIRAFMNEVSALASFMNISVIEALKLNRFEYRSRGKGKGFSNQKKNYSTMRIRRASAKQKNIRARGAK